MEKEKKLMLYEMSDKIYLFCYYYKFEYFLFYSTIYLQCDITLHYAINFSNLILFIFSYKLIS